MRFVVAILLMLAVNTLRGQQSFSAELLGMSNGVSAILSFNSPLFKSEKVRFSQVGRFGINYDGENGMVFMMSNLGYSWSPSFTSTAGALYLGGEGIAPTIGLQAVSVRKHRMLMIYPIVTLQSKPQIWLISAAQFEKELKKEKKAVLGISALQLFANGGHEVTVGILHLGFKKRKLEYGLASYLMFFGKEFEFHYYPGIFVKYSFL